MKFFTVQPSPFLSRSDWEIIVFYKGSKTKLFYVTSFILVLHVNLVICMRQLFLPIFTRHLMTFSLLFL